MGEQYVTKDDLEEFKKALVKELKNAEVQLKETNGCKLLTPVYHRWIHDTRSSRPFNTPFQILLHYKHSYKIWDAVRKMVCSVCDVTTVAAIRPDDQAMALDFCEKLCEFTYNYMKNYIGDADG